MSDRSKGEVSIRPPSGKDDLLAWLDTKRESARKGLPEFQMRLNLAFVLGHQWVEWQQETKAFRRPRIDPNNPNEPVRITANKIGGIIERTVSKLTKNTPGPEARPVSDDDQDVSSARVATRILLHELDRLDWDWELVRFLFWPASIGWSYMHIYWNPDAGPLAGVLDEDGDQPEELKQGEVVIEQVPAFELALQPGAKTLHEALWAVRTTTMSRETIFERWGVEVSSEIDRARSMIDDLRALNAETSTDSAQQVAVHQFWMKPCRAAPGGLVVTWTGDTILEKIDRYPYAHGRLPFEQCDLLPGLGTQEGRTWVNDLIPLQVDYNDARSREATMRRQLVPKLVAPAGAIDPQRVGSRVEVISYNPTGAAPQWVGVDSNWMNQFEAGMGRSDAEMGERAGASDVSQGNAPSTMPAAAILALQEADDTKLAVSAKSLSTFIKNVGWQILMLTKQFWTEERTVRVYSEEGALEAFRYNGADISDRLDVHVSSESALPRSKAARVQLALELHARGVIPDPQTLIRMLDLPGTDFITRDWDADTRRQMRELTYMLQGEDAEVREFDNHLAHMAAIDRFRKTIDYEQLDPQTKAIVDAHYGVHAGMAMPQMGVPTPPGTPHDPAAAENAAVNTAHYIDPMTGLPPNPTDAAAGLTPGALDDQTIRAEAGIGQAAGQPGRVPGIPADTQAASMGA